MRKADPEEQLTNPKVADIVLRHLLRAAAMVGLPTMTAGYEVILRELQRLANKGKIPKGSLTFDADHAGAVTRFNVIVTYDQGLASSLKTLSKKLDLASGGGVKPIICENAKQLRKALKL